MQRQPRHTYPLLPIPVTFSHYVRVIGCPLWGQVLLTPPSHVLHVHSQVTHGHGQLPLSLRATGHAVQAAEVQCPSSGTGTEELPGEGEPPVHPSPSSRRKLAAIPLAAVQAYSLQCLCPPTST